MTGKVAVVGGVSPISRAWIEAKVIRKDGTVEDLGVIADSGLLMRAPEKPSIRERLRQWLRR